MIHFIANRVITRILILNGYSLLFVYELEMCQYDTDAPAQGPSPPGKKHFAKKEKKVEKGPLLI